MNAISTKLSETGRLTVPAKLRAAAGLEPGGEVVLDIVGGELRIRTVAQALASARAKARAMLAGKSGVSVDDFLADRRGQAARER
ncbi:MAG TPA: AbrB/MazE/SpoVT family DNA-binding domain-containing protein [Caulobacteraceae bacterium]|nr:AbrB/MazE/SpoVT family DNA-binding domain-containing protein [Caulobacteraceae bacterium]